MMNDGHFGNILEGRKHKFQKRPWFVEPFCQFYVKFKGFMKLKLVSIEACQNVKNEFDNNMSNLSECSK